MTREKTHLQTEESFLAGESAAYGTKRSARPDVYDPNTGIIYDYKFIKNPGKGLSSKQINKNAQNVPNVPNVTNQYEINP